MTDIKWEAPPPDARKSTRWSQIAETLKEKPNEWALISEDASCGVTTRINQGQGPWAPAGAFQSRSAGVDGSRARYKIWARYVGEIA